jgi:lysozyme
MGDFNLIQRLEKEEGRRTHLYQDSLGIWTIGVGYNIQEKGLPHEIIDRLFALTVQEATTDAQRIPEYYSLDGARRTVLVAMVFQMGLSRVMGFAKMRGAIRDSHYQLAGDEMLDSKWANQSPARAEREAQIMRTGRYNTWE